MFIGLPLASEYTCHKRRERGDALIFRRNSAGVLLPPLFNLALAWADTDSVSGWISPGTRTSKWAMQFLNNFTNGKKILATCPGPLISSSWKIYTDNDDIIDMLLRLIELADKITIRHKKATLKSVLLFGLPSKVYRLPSCSLHCSLTSMTNAISVDERATINSSASSVSRPLSCGSAAPKITDIVFVLSQPMYLDRT